MYIEYLSAIYNNIHERMLIRCLKNNLKSSRVHIKLQMKIENVYTIIICYVKFF
jgi:hypothetical protein